MKREFVVVIDLPKGVDVTQMATYIHTAVVNWARMIHPKEPFGQLDIKATIKYDISGVDAQVRSPEVSKN